MEHGEAVEVISEVGERRFKSTSSFSDAAKAVAAKLSNAPEGMFDTRADVALLLILTFLGSRERILSSAFFTNIGEHVEAFQDGSNGRANVSTVSPQKGATVTFAQEFFDRLRVVHGGIGDGEGLDKLTGRIDLHVVLVAVITLMVLLGPASLQVLLALAAGLSSDALGHLATLDLLVLVTAVSLLGSFDKTGINNLAATGDQA